MSTVMPQGELMRKAVSFIAEGVEDGKDFEDLMRDACMRFNLGPKDEVFLRKFFREKQG